MAHQTSRRRVRADPTSVSTGRAILHAAVSGRRRLPPGRPERRSLGATERKHPAVLVLEIALRAATGDPAGTSRKGKRRRPSPAFARGKQPGQSERLLRSRGHARTETRPETSESRTNRG